MFDFLKRNAGNIARTLISPAAQLVFAWNNSRNQPSNNMGAAVGRAAATYRKTPAPTPTLRPQPLIAPAQAAQQMPQFVFNMPAMQSVPVPPRQDYTAQLAALSAREIAELDNRAITAREAFGILESEADATRQRLKTQNIRELGTLRRNFRQMEDTATRKLGSAGQLTNPFVAGRALQQLAQQQQSAVSGARAGYTDKLSELNTTMASAARKRDSELAAIERLRKQIQGDTNRLIAGSPI